jgi:hypothetical protein
MASRPLAGPYPIIGTFQGQDSTVSGDMSANITSKPSIIDNLSMISYDISWTGTAPVGTMTVQVSNTYKQNPDGSVRNPGNWTTLTLSAPTPVSVSPNSGFIDVDASGAYAIRLMYNRTSGTGTMVAVVSAKVA